MERDVCRRRRVVIYRKQAEAVVRLFSSHFCVETWLDYSGLCCGERLTGRPPENLFPIDMRPLCAEGEFRPSEWIPADWEDKSKQTVRSVIRAVCQPQTRWTCLRLPDLPKLNRLLRAIDPLDGWDLGKTNEAVSIRLKIDGKPYTGLGPEAHRMLCSDWLAQEEGLWRQTATSSTPHKVLIADAIKRLNRFLPHLIVLSGGKVKFS